MREFIVSVFYDEYAVTTLTTWKGMSMGYYDRPIHLGFRFSAVEVEELNPSVMNRKERHEKWGDLKALWEWSSLLHICIVILYMTSSLVSSISAQ